MRESIELKVISENRGCKRITFCSFYEATNPKLRESYCHAPESENCFIKRGGKRGKFTSPRGGEHYFS